MKKQEGNIGDYPNFSSIPKKSRKKIPAMHTLSPDEVGKFAAVDNKFYEGHVGFYPTKRTARRATFAGKLLYTKLYRNAKRGSLLEKILNKIIWSRM